MSFNLQNIVRDNIRALKPYATARHEYKGVASIYLDANENAYGTPVEGNYNRYPDPNQVSLTRAIAKLKGINDNNLLLGHGSDELIDLAFRIFCEPGRDHVIICPPTYGMYGVSANINNIGIKEIPLTVRYQLDVENILTAIEETTRIIFICSPNNPTGNIMNADDIRRICSSFNGIVLLDEAYIDFALQGSFAPELQQYPNLIIIQTLSKAWGMAGLRLGLGIASAEIIELFKKVKPPYNINQCAQDLALDALKNKEKVIDWIDKLKENRKRLMDGLKQFLFIENIYPSSANFILVKVKNANELYQFLSAKGIIVRNRHNLKECSNCLRITIGTEKENKALIDTLKNY